MTNERHNFVYVECDLPDGVTISTWRRDRYARSHKAQRRHVRAFLRRALVLVRPNL